MRALFAITALILLILPSYGIIETKKNLGNNFIGKFEKEVFIEAGNDFYIHFSPSHGIELKEQFFNLSDIEKIALAKSPQWIRLRLAKQFENLGDDYARLIINSSKKYVDEIAFSIATCPADAAPSTQFLYDNAYFIYKNDEYLDYVDVIDFENGSSTIRFKTL